MTEHGTMGFIPKIHLCYRIHKNQFSGNWETRRERIKYLAEKTQLPIPEYTEMRNKGFFFLIARNSIKIHLYFFSIFSIKITDLYQIIEITKTK